MTSHNRLPIHTRLGTYTTIILLLILCLFMLRNCVYAIYYGAITNEREISSSYKLGLVDGQKQNSNLNGQQKERIMNPLLLKKYQEGFRDSRDRKRTK